jgi:hypothetical protein
MRLTCGAHEARNGTTRVTRPWIAPALWLAYITVPVEGWGLFPGRPIDLLSIVAVASVSWLAFVRGSIPGAAVAAVALIAKVALGLTLLVPRGFDARYYANAAFAPPMERSTGPSNRTFTRIDTRLRFGRDDAPDVPLEFFNDTRFNLYDAQERVRETLPFSVTWHGFWKVDGEPQRLYVHAPAGAVAITIGDRYRAQIHDTADWQETVMLPPGFHRVVVSWAVPQGGARQFEAGRIVDGRDEAFDGATVFRRPAGRALLAVDRAVGWIAFALDAMICAGLIALAIGSLRQAYSRLRTGFNPRDAVALAWAIGTVDALIFALPAVGRTVILSGGNDWLTYESLARDIGLNGLWMRLGAPFGQGRPFYAQPLYAYFLAACHFLTGPDFVGIYFVQRLFCILTVILIWRTSAMLFDEAAGAAALVASIVVVYEKFSPWSGILLSETLFVPLACLWVYALVAIVRRPDAWVWRAAVAGVIGALATLTRSSLLLGWIAAVPALAASLPRTRRTRVVAVTVLAMAAVTSLATLRNWVVAHELVLVSSEGGVVLSQGNPAPANLVVPFEHKAFYASLGLDPLTQTVVEYARQQPRAFANGLWAKARFTLGWFQALLPGSTSSWLYVVTWILAVIGVAMVPRTPSAVPRAAALIGALVAASHFVVVVVFLPYVYGDRMIMPLYVLLVPYAALPLLAAARWIRASGTTRTVFALWLLPVGAAIAQLAGLNTRLDLVTVAIAALVAGLCVNGVPDVRFPVALAASGYAIAQFVWLLRRPLPGTAAACRVELLFLALALFSSVLVADRNTRTATGLLVLVLVALASVLISLKVSWSGVWRDALSWPPAFDPIAALSALAGLVAVVAAAARPHARFSGAAFYIAAAALSLGAVHWIGLPPHPERALLSGRIAAYGIAGAAAYCAVWMAGWWPSGGGAPASRMKEGVLLGAFAAGLFGVDLSGVGAALPIVAGLTFGAVRADRV